MQLNLLLKSISNIEIYMMKIERKKRKKKLINSDKKERKDDLKKIHVNLYIYKIYMFKYKIWKIIIFSIDLS